MNFSELGKHYKLTTPNATTRTKALAEADQQKAAAGGKGMITVRVGPKSASKALYMTAAQYEAFRESYA